MDKIEEGIERLFSYIKENLQIHNEIVELLLEVLTMLSKPNYLKYLKKYNAIQNKSRAIDEKY